MYNILEKWDKKQLKLRKSGLDPKYVANLSIDKPRYDDLAKLVSLGGPFTDAKEVERYITSTNISDKEKNQRLYMEIRFAQNSFDCYPKNSEIF